MLKQEQMLLKPGLYTALITPFLADDKIDWPSLKKLLDLQLRARVTAIVILGTTGESATLSFDEKCELIKFTRDYIDNYSEKTAKNAKLVSTQNTIKPLLVVGTGGNCTTSSIKMTITAENLGADAAMIVAPYYNKPPQRGIYEHFHLIHENSTIPLIIYNIPGRSVINISNSTIRDLVQKHPRIQALKDATGDLGRPLELYEILNNSNNMPDYIHNILDFSQSTIVSSLAEGKLGASTDGKFASHHQFLQLAGDDALTMGFYAQGGHGAVSVASNICPFTCSVWHNHLLKGEFAKALPLGRYMAPIFQALFADTNPIPAKYLAYRLGYINNPQVRAPLCIADEELTHKLDKIANIIRICEEKYIISEENTI